MVSVVALVTVVAMVSVVAVATVVAMAVALSVTETVTTNVSPVVPWTCVSMVTIASLCSEEINV